MGSAPLSTRWTIRLPDPAPPLSPNCGEADMATGVCVPQYSRVNVCHDRTPPHVAGVACGNLSERS